MRNLVVCLDGTWNTPDQQDRGRQVPSNVVKMARAVKEGLVDQELTQEVYYDTGVGTDGWWDKLLGGVTGKGIGLNIKQAYGWLANNYQNADDQIFLFGFSRGAYTARSLAGLVGLCGLPGPDQAADVDAAIAIYRTADAGKRQQMAEEFKQKDGIRNADIHFIGVWDTVGALGVPVGIFKRKLAGLTEFHDVTLGKQVRNAYHALAINERRKPFKPTLWDPARLQDGQNLIQVWFPGVHSNVGGGYADTGLSDRAFLWMMARARAHGLKPDERYIEVRVDPNWFGELRDSFTTKYKIFSANRPHTREIGRTNDDTERLHRSAVARWTHKSKPEKPPANYDQAMDKPVPIEELSDWEREFNLRRR